MNLPNLPVPGPVEPGRRKAFRRTAQSVAATIEGGGEVECEPQEREGGACGWRGAKTVFVLIDGAYVECSATVNITVKGSAKWDTN